MFLYNRGYYKTIESVNPHGIVINASLIHGPALLRRDRSYDNLKVILFDPQFYLYEINRQTCTKAYIRLATYPWFNENPPDFNSKEIKIKQWKKQLAIDNCKFTYPKNDSEIRQRIANCLFFQEQLGVTHFIIPTPLAKTREDQFSEQIKWIQLGVEQKRNFNKPLLATIALSEDIILNTTFEENLVIQTILDFLPTITELDGYYIVLERQDSSLHIVDKSICRTMLELSYVLGGNSNKTLIVNFLDVFGLVCLAAGATAFASGYSNKERRLSFNNFNDRKGGPQLPRFYSNALIGDFFTERDLDQLIDYRLIRYIAGDITIYSEPLIRELKKGNSASKIPSWEERFNNSVYARNHRIESLVQQANKINQYKTIPEKLHYVLAWLQEAEARMDYLNKRLKELSEKGNHINIWRSSLEEFMEDNGL